MPSAIFSDGRPMTEPEFLALGETSERIELFNGSLLVTPNPTLRHQRISRQLANALDHGAEAAGLDVDEAVNIRLGPDRIFIPDLVISAGIDADELIIDVAAVRLVCEITSPSDSATDKVTKMHYYAAAGIRWYLLVEQQTCVLHLYELVGTAYAERSVIRPGEVLQLTDPVIAAIDPADLQPRH
ncbi:Uma2 family endonuclease [Micromonosporaceae bacterium Da 78-11]